MAREVSTNFLCVGFLVSELKPIDKQTHLQGEDRTLPIIGLAKTNFQRLQRRTGS